MHLHMTLHVHMIMQLSGSSDAFPRPDPAVIMRQPPRLERPAIRMPARPDISIYATGATAGAELLAEHGQQLYMRPHPHNGASATAIKPGDNGAEPVSLVA
jgi:hypothetical protein